MKTNHWKLWQPSKQQPWNVRRVVHLHRRAGYAATGLEIQRDLKSGPDTAIQRLLDGKSYEYGVPEDFDSVSNVIGDSAVSSGNPNRLQAWWLYRMLFSPDPLGEKLTLLWHNHFATSNGKINDLTIMRNQNEIFREYGCGKYAELFSAVLHDPAILIYLDADSNRAEHPNENLGREMLELFSIGEGNYSESDVRNAALALTGWTVEQGRYVSKAEYHDSAEKKFLGQQGKFDGDDAVRIAADHPATAKRIAWRICNMLMGEGVVQDEALIQLAEGLRQNELRIGWAVETVLRSREFFSESNIGNRILDPADFLVGMTRSIGAHSPPPSTLVMVDWINKLGQRIFFPPNVFGWDGGRNWITSQTNIARMKFARDLLEGNVHQRPFELGSSFRASVDSSLDEHDVNTLAELLLSADTTALLENVPDNAKGDLMSSLMYLLTSVESNLG